MERQRKSAAAVFACGVAMVLAAGPARAHVSMDYPNGGEELEIGSVVRLAWSDEVSHGPATYDLWYSVTGPDGPWITIEGGLSPGTFFFDWVVPDAPSDQVRLRVKQDNDETDYYDISDADLAFVEAAETLEVALDAVKDATIYEDGDGTNANGSGSYLFAGRNAAQGGAAERRALLAFPIEGSIPEGAVVTSVSLELTMDRTISGAHTVGLHRLLEDWSEGPSDPSGQEGSGAPAGAGDVTWMHRQFPDLLWSAPGAAFDPSASATEQISSVGDYTFSSTPGLIADVQGWLDDPSTNFGWALVADPAPTGSAKRFDSRDSGSASDRPTLVVTYTTGGQVLKADFNFTPAHPRPGDEVQFNDRSSGQPVSWNWDFGDGQTSQLQNPTHIFGTSGVFTVTLEVSDISGDDSAVANVLIGAPVRRPSRRVAPDS